MPRAYFWVLVMVVLVMATAGCRKESEEDEPAPRATRRVGKGPTLRAPEGVRQPPLRRAADVVIPGSVRPSPPVVGAPATAPGEAAASARKKTGCEAPADEEAAAALWAEAWPEEWKEDGFKPLEVTGDDVQERLVEVPGAHGIAGMGMLELLQICQDGTTRKLLQVYGDAVHPLDGFHAGYRDLQVTIRRSEQARVGDQVLPAGPEEVIYRFDGKRYDRGETLAVHAPGCPAGQHDGGAELCVPVGACAEGYRLTRAGRCEGWSSLGPLPVEWSYANAARLPEERFLLVGGALRPDGEVTGEAALLDVTAREWSKLPPLPAGRYQPATVGLRSMAGVLVAGGEGEGEDNFSDKAWVFVESDGSWQPVAAMSRPRGAPAGIAVPAASYAALGNVAAVVVGGQACPADAPAAPEQAPATADAAAAPAPLPPPVAELFLDKERRFKASAPASHYRSSPALAWVDEGRLLVAGGIDCRTGAHVLEAEIYDVRKDSWSAADTLRGESARFPRLIALGNGRLLFLRDRKSEEEAHTQLWEPMQARWVPVSADIAAKGCANGPLATRLADGRVLAVCCPELWEKGQCTTWHFDAATLVWSPGIELEETCRPTALLSAGDRTAVLFPCSRERTAESRAALFHIGLERAEPLPD